MGYILRLMDLNHYESPSWILQLANIKSFLRSKVSFTFDNQLDLSGLSKLTEVDEATLAPLMYLPAGPVRTKMGDYLIFGEAMPQHLIRPQCPKVCPGCLRESRHVRKVWELAPFTACPIHKCVLLDECPNCQRRIGWVRPGISQCKCQADWRDFRGSAARGEELIIGRRIYELCNLATDNIVGPRIDSANPLANLADLKSFISALFFIAGQYERVEETGKRPITSKKNSELHSLLSKSLCVFDDWPIKFFSFLDWYRTKSGRRRLDEDNGIDMVTRGDFGYKFAFYEQLTEPQFNFLRSAFEGYIEVRRRERLITSAQVNNILPESQESAISAELLKREYLDASDTRKTLNISKRDLKWLIETGRLKAIINTQRQKTIYLIEKSSVEHIQAASDVLLSNSEVAQMLGLKRERISELVMHKLLKPLRGRAVTGERTWKFSQKEVESLLTKLYDKLKKRDRRGARQRVALNSTLRRLGRARIDLGMLVKAIINDEIIPLAKWRTKKGLAGFLFCEQDVSGFIKNKVHDYVGDSLSIPKAAKALDVRDVAVSFLINKGIIKAEVNRNLPALRTLISRGELEAFNSKYVLAGKLAHELQTTSLYLVRLLCVQGINAISGKEVDGGWLYVYRRSDLEKVDLPALITTAKANKRNQLTKHRAISVVEAAKLFNVGKDSLLGLVERGILKPHCNPPKSGRDNDELYFSLYLIEKYMDKIESLEGLITSRIAASMLGISESNFNEYYVKKGPLQIAIAHRNYRNYFRRADIEKLVKERDDFRRRTMPSNEAAALLEVNVSCIHKLTSDGLLKPVSGPCVDSSSRSRFLRRDVEQLKLKRQKFKSQSVADGKTTRYGRPGGPRSQPIQATIAPRIEQLSREWSLGNQTQRISGTRIHRQLIGEGYKVSVMTVYAYLRQKQLLVRRSRAKS